MQTVAMRKVQLKRLEWNVNLIFENMLSQVKRSAIRTETLDAEVNSSRSSGRGEEEVGRNIKEEEEKVEKSSSPETSPPASSSGLQTRQGKRKKTVVKTGYSFFCDEVLLEYYTCICSTTVLSDQP